MALSCSVQKKRGSMDNENKLFSKKNMVQCVTHKTDIAHATHSLKL